MAAEPLSLGHWRQSRCHWVIGGKAAVIRSLAAKPLSLGHLWSLKKFSPHRVNAFLCCEETKNP